MQKYAPYAASHFMGGSFSGLAGFHVVVDYQNCHFIPSHFDALVTSAAAIV